MRQLAVIAGAAFVALVAFGAVNLLAAITITVVIVGYALCANEDSGDDLP